MTPQFHTLTVTGLRKTIRDAIVVTLAPDDPAAFAFTPGQYLTFRREFDGVELRRSYSICAGRDDGVLQVGIKRVEGGSFSSWANSALKIGDQVEAMPPMGNFYAPPPNDQPHYLAFAGGSGITPVLSILKSGLHAEPGARFTLVYANRNPGTIMFREELEDLKNQYMGRFSVIHILEEGSEEIDLFQGRVSGEKCARLFAHWIDINSVSLAYICGPEPMMLAISEALVAHGLANEQIRFELFASGQPGRAKRPAAVANADAAGIPGQVTLNGATHRVTIQPETSLLQAALDDDLDAPHACTAGVCSTCKAKLTRGKVEMIANHALQDDEVEAGYVLTCQSYPVSDDVAWDYDQAGH